jgi:O-antigen/teichoic acid export membrane protein
MVFSKGLQVSVSVATVPLMITYLGQEAYGLVMAIMSFTILFCMDMGISEGVKLRLIECFARADRRAAQAYIATGFFGLVIFALVIGVALATLFPNVDWQSFFNLSASTPVSEKTLAATVGLSMLTVVALIPLKLLKEVLTASQRGYIFSLFTSAGILLSLLAIYLAVAFDLGVFGIVIALQGSMFLAYIAMWLHVFLSRFKWVLPQPRYVSSQAFRSMWKECLMMFLMSIGFLAINGTDVFIVNHYVGQSDAATYAVAIRLFMYVEVVLSFALYPLWPALGDAIQRKEREWVQSVSRHALVGTIGVGLALLFAVVLFGRPILAFWTRNIIEPPLALHLLFGLYFGIRIIASAHATLLRAHGRINRQSISQALEAILHVTLCILLVQRMGLIGMVLGAIISIALTQAWVLPMEYWQICRTYQRGATDGQ